MSQYLHVAISCAMKYQNMFYDFNASYPIIIATAVPSGISGITGQNC